METSTSSSNIVELEGDLFDAPDGAALIRVFTTCYTQTRWKSELT